MVPKTIKTIVLALIVGLCALVLIVAISVSAPPFLRAALAVFVGILGGMGAIAWIEEIDG